jgi:hypothetical protein
LQTTTPEQNLNAMKKAVIIIVLVFAAGIVLSSCNKEACPAYSQVDTEQVDPAA